MDCTAGRPREKVLILVRHERTGRPYIEVYGDRRVDCRIVTVPFVGTNRGEIMAERLVENQLPWCYRDLMWPGNLRAHNVVTLQRPSDVVDRYNHLQLLRGLDHVGKKPKRRRAR